MKNTTKQFEKMRPYNDEEVKEAMKRIIQTKEFEAVLQYVFPERSLEESLLEMSKVTSTDDFQKRFSSHAVEEVLRKTATDFSYSGMEHLEKDKSYLFISNHRDIVMDSAILQNVLLTNGYRTTQITFGSNLMKGQFVIDLGKVNKMFTFYRGGGRAEIYKNAFIHSEYIQKVINEVGDSVWIAQRDGRTKDGNDQTRVSLIKMLTMVTNGKDVIETLQSCNIVPVSISYEYEPCDLLKIREKLNTIDGKYEKHSEEDFQSILHGIVSQKGKVHMAFCKPVNQFIEENKDRLDSSIVHQEVANFMDREIHKNYQLNPINEFAYDFLNSNQDWDSFVESNKDYKEYASYFDNIAKEFKDKSLASEELLKMYAAPKVNVLIC